MKQLIAIFTFITLSVILNAQNTLTITGKVKLSNSFDNSEITVKFKSLMLPYKDTTITTDENGGYSYTLTLQKVQYLTTLSPASFDIILSKSGYTNDTVKLTLINTPGTTTMPTRILSPEGIELYKPDICIVTNINKYNYVVWDRYTGENIDYYIVYKENHTTFQFDSIGKIDFENESVFEDTIPTKGLSDKYQIIAILENGTASNLSDESSSINLTLTVNNNIVSLNWINNIEIIGFNADLYDTLRVFRSTDSKKYDTIKEYNLANFVDIKDIMNITDTILNSGTYSYQVGLSLKNPCESQITHTKTESGPFSQSLSNIAESNVVVAPSLTTEINRYHELTLKSNPAKGSISIIIPEKGELQIFDCNGKQLQTKTVEVGTIRIPMPEGRYFVQLKAQKIYSAKAIVE